jgi:hypothetical protein
MAVPPAWIRKEWSNLVLNHPDAAKALNEQMFAKGLGYEVPPELNRLYQWILSNLFSVSDLSDMTEDQQNVVERRAKMVMAQGGYHFFSSVCGRGKYAPGESPAVINGLQTRFAVIACEGNQKHIVGEMNAAGISVASSTGNRKLLAVEKDWLDHLRIDDRSCQLVWIDNFETLVFAGGRVNRAGQPRRSAAQG